MKANALAFACCVAVASLSGCALTTEQVELNYAQQAGVSRIAGAEAVSVNVQVADQRLDKSKVSSKKNGYGMEMAPITAAEDVAVTPSARPSRKSSRPAASSLARMRRGSGSPPTSPASTTTTKSVSSPAMPWRT